MPFPTQRLKRKRSQSSSSSDSDHHLADSDRSVVVYGRLFVLPYDLLEEIATTYFMRHEAIALATVNSQFHAAFSRNIWHKLNATKNPMWRIPHKVWRKYGHLVRCATIDLDENSIQWCTKMPNLTKLTLYFNDLGNGFAGHVVLLNLRRVQFVTYGDKWTTSSAMKCMDIARQLEQRNKTLLVQWDFNLKKDEHIAVLDTIISRIDDTDRYSLSIRYQVSSPLIMSHFSKLSKMLVKLDTSVSFNYLNYFFRHHNSRTEYTFPRLTTLRLWPRHGIFEDGFMSSIFTPVRFPSLKNIQYISIYSMTGLPGFSSWTNHNWSTIMELNLQSASDSHAMNQMLEKVPNLERLILQGCRLSLETIFLAKHLPCLKYFEFGGDVRLEDSYPHISHTPMTSLKEIVFRLEEYGIKYCNCANSRELLLSLILCGGAPSLRSLEFRGNGVFDWTTYTRKKRSHVNKAVRTLILHDERTGFDVSTAPKIKAMFPNLKFLKLRECTAAAKKKLAKRYPHLIITVEPI